MSRTRWIVVGIVAFGLAILWMSQKGSASSAFSLRPGQVQGLNAPPAAAAPITGAQAGQAGAAAINAKNLQTNMTPPAPVQKLLGFVGL